MRDYSCLLKLKKKIKKSSEVCLNFFIKNRSLLVCSESVEVEFNGAVADPVENIYAQAPFQSNNLNRQIM